MFKVLRMGNRKTSVREISAGKAGLLRKRNCGQVVDYVGNIALMSNSPHVGYSERCFILSTRNHVSKLNLTHVSCRSLIEDLLDSVINNIHLLADVYLNKSLFNSLILQYSLVK